MAPLYYRNAAVAVVCFDIMDEESFQKMKDWVEELRTNVPEGKLVLAIACTKVMDNASVSFFHSAPSFF